MSKIFEGTVTINAIAYNVTGPLSKKGNRISGTLAFIIDDSKAIPLQLIYSNGQVTSSRETFFVTPPGDIIKMFNIQGADTTVDAALSSVEIEVDIERNGIDETMTIDISALKPALEVDSLSINEASSSIAGRHTLVPVRINELGNMFDHFGALTSLPRYQEETNKSYLKRIKNAISHKSNSTYKGLINGINRSLGLVLENQILITIKDTHTEPLNEIRLVIDESMITIYSKWVSEEEQALGARPTIEQEVALGLEPIQTVGKLVDWINESSNYQAVVKGSAERSTKDLVKFDSIELIRETIPAQHIVSLKHNSIRLGSVSFRQNTLLQTQRAVDSDLEYGEYSIDYDSGRIVMHTPPSAPLEVTYLASMDNFTLQTSSIKIIDLSTDAANEIYFNQIEKDLYKQLDDKTVNSLPTNEMFGILKTILSGGSYPQYWGP